MSSNAIGIDLGTTYSCVGVVRNGRVEIVGNDMGYRTTPSCVAFTDEQMFVGEAAKNQQCTNLKNTICEAKRLIGRNFCDSHVQGDIKQWPFKVIDDAGAPKIQVAYKKQQKVFAPEQISAMVLKNMKSSAEMYLGCAVKDAVITVPAYFNDSQRQATIDAGKIAGLNVLALLTEPTAAAIAYGVDKRITKKQNVLVFDLGGGTFDVVILEVEYENFRVLAVGGDTHLGGGDFDSRLVDHYIDYIRQKSHKDLSCDERAKGRLRIYCEKAKRNLSSSMKTIIDIPGLFDGKDFKAALSKIKFDDLCADLFEKTISHVSTVLSDAKLSKSDIDEVILVGGSSRIPKVQELLGEFFNGKKLNRTINPDEAVAYGATLKAAMLADAGGDSMRMLSLTDVIPLSLGLENADGAMVTAINRNTVIPVTVAQDTWTTKYNYQTGGRFCVREGEEKIARNNNLLGTFVLKNIQLAPAGVPKFKVTFTVDVNGILHVSAIDSITGSSNDITITCNKGRLSGQDIENMIEEQREFEQDSREQNEDPTASRHGLEAYCFSQKLVIGSKSFKDGISDHERDAVLGLLDETLEWMEENDGATKVKYDRKLRDLKQKCAPYLARLMKPAVMPATLR